MPDFSPIRESVLHLDRERLRRILEELTGTEGALGSALIALDGIVIADNFVVEVNLEKLAALLSSVYNTLQRVFGDLKQGDVQASWIETDRYGFLVQAVDPGLLVVVVRHDVPIGLIRLSMRKAVVQLKRAERPI
jgi:predicted regulator of Ras-like GTPase activity (Roadblock/LC7/MglB family)